MLENADELFNRYQNLALTYDDKKTAQDFHLRELEIEFALPYVEKAQYMLDIGCGIGYTSRVYAGLARCRVTGLDYSPNMISAAEEISAKSATSRIGSLDFICRSVVDTGLETEFDLIVGHRCLMALLDWELQKTAILELVRILRPGGRIILFEGTVQGLEKLNSMRRRFDLQEIEGSGKDALFTLKFDEVKLADFLTANNLNFEFFGFGTYYFLSRIFYPLHIAPDSPKFDSSYNEIAKKIASEFPNLVDVGHLKAIVIEKKIQITR